MAENKTVATGADVAAYLAAVADPNRREDAVRLDLIFREVSGFVPKMWGPSIIGYGRYAYTYESGRQGEMCATGFSPRRAEHSIYILPGYEDYGDLLGALGRHRTGKACLYVKRLSDIDETVLRQLIRRGLDDLARRWPVMPE